MAINMTPRLLLCAVLVLSFMADSCLAEDGYKAKFKGFFGKVVTTRTYPSEEMKQKALDIWKDKGEVLELDGTTSKPGDDHANESQNTTTVPSVGETPASSTSDELVDSSGQKLEPLPEGEPIPVIPAGPSIPNRAALKDDGNCNRLAGEWKQLWSGNTPIPGNYPHTNIEVAGNLVTIIESDGKRIQHVCHKSGDYEWQGANGWFFKLEAENASFNKLTVHPDRGSTNTFTRVLAPPQKIAFNPSSEPQGSVNPSGAGMASSGNAYALMQNSGCLACHAADKKILGPAFKDISAKYKGTSGALERLVSKVRNGGSGVWGPLPQPATPGNVSDPLLRQMVAAILDGQSLISDTSTRYYGNTAQTSQSQMPAAQDCSVLNGTWKTTFTNAATGKGSVLDWKWQVSRDRIVAAIYDSNGKLLTSSPVDKCSVSGNTVNYQMLYDNGEVAADVRLQLGADQQSFRGSGVDRKGGTTWNYVAQRVGGAPTASPNIKLDEGASAVVDMDTVGTSRSFSFKAKKK